MSRFLAAAMIIVALPMSAEAQANDSVVTGIYRVNGGIRNGLTVWIVDGKMIRDNVYPEFLYGGNGQRYTFVPKGEIWIDHAIAAEEFEYTVRHELTERSLMARLGWTYAAAHDSALEVERELRLRDRQMCVDLEHRLPAVAPKDAEGEKEIESLSDSVRLIGVYRQFVGERNGVSVWIVDGAAVRRDIYPDFGFSGNNLAYHFIPNNQIWIDGQVSCEEMEFSIQCELDERKSMLGGMSYDDAYEAALRSVKTLRNQSEAIAGSRSVMVPQVLDRDTGTGDEQ